MATQGFYTKTPEIPRAIASGDVISDLNFQGLTFGSVFDAASIGFADIISVEMDFDGKFIDLVIERADGEDLSLDGDIDFFREKDLEAFWDNYSYIENNLLSFWNLWQW
ncbi:MAG: hypothetical protein TH68_07770 [Candidatus Synechococcus spongiarum 142]|uniref:Uncharacterized protein n=1 Tax=Candidatus Synechococcus spongiarum 142 TaxID=1608213 RepID=A0A6N3X348_9SYNE|nr:MAG: hypothetical protein TH68_07770 [Candidatus Synechococcus spongiarum 142]